MRFPDPLLPGRLLRRYKRFLADVRLETGEEVTAHCANPGSMMGLAEPDSPVWLSPARNPDRKLRYSWELVARDGALVGINTAHPNTIVAEALADGSLPALSGYQRIRREVRYGQNSRVDFLLESDQGPPCYLEVKSVTLKRGDGPAEFPDAVTKRGAKHLAELSEIARAGARAVMFFLVQREDCAYMEVADDIDPAYGRALRDAAGQGVELHCHACTLSPQAIELDRRLALRL
ncbi:MAG: DNA/RNA nuclease SfsA [Kiloniellales bacterium]|nr:DNA/RNA nuclease SfsA [Kiloniellales bacterium]